MRTLTFTPPLLGFVVVTRAALGFGLGLLLSSKLRRSQRRRLGIALTTVGVATTIPAIALVRLGAGRSPAGLPATGTASV
jgi:hypothetical protein